MADRKVKVINPNNYKVGLKSMDGIREYVVHENNFILLDENEIYYTNNMSRIFSHKHLIIDDEQINQDLGYAEKTVANLDNDEIVKILKGTITNIKKELEGITEKHVIDKVIRVAKTIEDLPKNKITYLQEWSGYDFDQIVDTEDNKE
jgi:hypothetical protein